MLDDWFSLLLLFYTAMGYNYYLFPLNQKNIAMIMIVYTLFSSLSSVTQCECEHYFFVFFFYFVVVCAYACIGGPLKITHSNPTEHPPPPGPISWWTPPYELCEVNVPAQANDDKWWSMGAPRNRWPEPYGYQFSREKHTRNVRVVCAN